MSAIHRFSLALLLVLGFGLASVAPATAVSFNWHFTPTVGTATDGTITFASVNDREPTAFSCGLSGTTFTEADFVLIPFSTAWVSGVPAVVIARIADPSGLLVEFSITSAYIDLGFGGSVAAGTYSFSPIPEPSIAMLLGLGASLLAIRRRAVRH